MKARATREQKRALVVILERVERMTRENREETCPLLGSVSTRLASFVPSNGRGHNSDDFARARTLVSVHIKARTRTENDRGRFTEKTGRSTASKRSRNYLHRRLIVRRDRLPTRTRVIDQSFMSLHFDICICFVLSKSLSFNIPLQQVLTVSN